MVKPFIPDPLMRFSPTPFSWMLERDGRCICIESNELAITLQMWLALRKQPAARIVRQLSHVRLIVDHGCGYGGLGPGYVDGPLYIDAGPVRTLLVGRGTVLFYDTESHELLGFLAPEQTTEDLMRHVAELLCVEDLFAFACADDFVCAHAGDEQ
jgi:hypothetical protein